MEDKTKKKLLSVKVDAEYAEFVKNYAHLNLMSISDLLRAALVDYIGKDKLDKEGFDY